MNERIKFEFFQIYQVLNKALLLLVKNFVKALYKFILRPFVRNFT